MSSCTTCDLSGEDYLLRQKKGDQTTLIPKRIIICCDGTWQSAVSGKTNVPSNVTRLCRSLDPVGVDKDGNVWQQVVWYDSGVGTTSGAVGTAIEGAIGQGLEGNVIEAYNFCVLNYNPGDKIMCFGFSRGAFTARTIAGVISDIGICDKKHLNMFPDLWAKYKEVKPGKRFHRSDQWYEWIWGKADEHQGAGSGTFVYDKPPHKDWAQPGSRNVEVVGVYDTVGALGVPEFMGFKLPSRDAWHNVGLSPNIKHAFQALALDEYRKAFSPSVWYLPNKKATRGEVEARRREEDEAEKEYYARLEYAIDLKASGMATDAEVNAAAHQVNLAAKAWNNASKRRVKFQNRLEQKPVLKQVWFPGYHIHVGGGSSSTLKHEGDMEEMSNIAFSWMLDQIKHHLSINEKYLADERSDNELQLLGLNEALKKWRKSNDRETESWGDWTWRHAKAIASAIAHPLTPSNEPTYQEDRAFGWGTGELKDSYSTMYLLNGTKKRTPGEYALKKDGMSTVSLGETFEYIHPVVHFRCEHFKNHKKHPPYHPISGDVEFKRRKTEDGCGNPCYVYDILRKSSPRSAVVIPEWKLGGPGSFERLAIAGKAAHAYVKELDEELRPVSGPLTTVAPRTLFDCEYQSGDFQHATVESKAFSMKVSTVEVSTREVAHEERFSAVY